ncbi:RHS repeat domain-containing protein [Flavobacterium restrictum]|uniref:RHS repeat-associated core domain-containing protein n=1 Tax=Flavobacterium restrictum TaxID=2594428 RepID=A0A553DY04_9FLAO|nr:hypothetical protein [Flavobacterium restrictum]TRX37572.1 hypothetical protein FNW21_12370 [Flavobacterium restrictum]
MKKIYYLFIIIFSFSVLSAQEKLSKEEKARREKNIQAGNPFAQFGYKARIATLSNGKYLEFHDLDSIVTIGTVRWHVYKNEIVGRIVQDSLNPDAQPIGDRAGRWISPDPLSEEFPSWSPYNMCLDNPMKYKDPDGRAAKWIEGTDGKAVSHTTNSDGSLKWSSNASPDTQRIGNAMAKTDIGTQTLNNLESSSTKVTLKVDTEKVETLKNGATVMGYSEGTKDANGKITKFEMTVYEKAIDKISTPTTENSNPAIMKDGQMIILSNYSKDEKIGAVGTHEGTHIVNKDSNSLSSPKSTTTESKPNRNEAIYYNEIDQNKKCDE